MRKACNPELSFSTDRVVVGRVGRPHGLKGLILVHPETDDPGRFAPGSTLEVAGADLRIVSAHVADKGLLVRFEGISDRTAAEAIAGSEITISAAQRRRLGPDEFWPDELVGLEARTVAGSRIGVIEDVVEGVGQYRLVISTDGDTKEVPFVTELVSVIDVEAGYLTVADIDGLI